MPAYKYKLKNGKTRWYASFYATDWTGKTRRVVKRGFLTQREAKEYERSQLDQDVMTADILFSSLVSNYLSDMEPRLKPTTMAQKKNLIDIKILPYFQNLRVCDITPLHITKWQNEILSGTSKKGTSYSQTYMKTINNQLTAIFSYACKYYGLSSNPCSIAGSIGKSKAGEMSIWTADQFETFISFEKNRGMKLAFDILFFTGMRVGEMLALTPADILPDRNIDINKNYAVVEGEEMFLVPKTEKSKRKVKIPEFLYEEIYDYIDLMYHIEPEERIFYFTKGGIEKEFQRITEKSGLPRIRLHDLRHSHASFLIHKGISPIEIARRLGHESVKTTLDTYGHLYPDSDSNLADILENARPSNRRKPPDDSAE